jgi:formylglycine-generating enzyme required for sulfatase activity
MLIRTALALLILFSAAASAQDLDTALSAVVRISGKRGGTPVRGSGFVVGLDRNKATIVTASHVIEGVQQLAVTFAVDRTESFPAGVVLGMEAGNPRGLAAFQVRGTLPAGVTTLSFETEVQVQRGEDVYLLGFPQMATAPLARRGTFAGPDGNFLQLDMTAGEGFSGAPVLRKNGKVLGVVTDEDLQLTFAVKALVARDAVIGWGGKLGTRSSGLAASSSAKVPPLWPAPGMCIPSQEHTESGIVFVRICPGTFTMGSAGNDQRAESFEKPAHQVTLSEFWIGKTEITNDQYRRFRSDHQGNANLPVINVSWAEAEAACEHFGGRLPTEAEWEYAARAGSKTSFGEDEERLGEYAWYQANSGRTLHPVGTKKANAWGLNDMLGNAAEWVADWLGSYPGVAQTDPSGPSTGRARVVRGGSFVVGLGGLRSAFRGGFLSTDRNGAVGFRCAHVPRR